MAQHTIRDKNDTAEPPFFWECYPPHAVARIEREAIAWFDGEMAVLKSTKRAEREARRQSRRLARAVENCCPDLAAVLRTHALPEHVIRQVRAAIVELVREVLADDLPGALRVLGVRNTGGTRR